MVGTSLRDLARLRKGKRKRESSWDKTGGDKDFVRIPPGKRHTLLDIKGAGCITHIWITARAEEKSFLRKIVIRAYWDGQDHPSIQAPLGDFFGMGHGLTANYWSIPLSMSPQDGTSFNCFFAMPFSEGARIEVSNDGDVEVDHFYYYVDFELHSQIDEEFLRFHAVYNRQCPTDGIPEDDMKTEEWQWGGTNLTGEGNYVILDTEGQGHYVGAVLNIHNLRRTLENNWYGSGDDMIFIDGESFPPSLHGTGLEDYFNTAWCPAEQFSSPYHGISRPGGLNWSGKITYYRFHIQDPIMFAKKIKVTIEHGHANRRNDDYSSVAYWYQTLPTKPFSPVPNVEDRMPLEDMSGFWR
jgi:hypothetical protein